MRWSSEISPLEDLQPLIYQMLDFFDEQVRIRKTLYAAKGRPNVSADLEVYFSTDYATREADPDMNYQLGGSTVVNVHGDRGTVHRRDHDLRHSGWRQSPKEQAILIGRFEDHMQGTLRATSGVKDRVRLSTAAEMPVCDACGSHRPAY